MSIFSDIKIFPFNSEGTNNKTVAVGSVVVSGTVRVNFKVINGKESRFVALPNEPSNKVDEVTKQKKYYPVVQFTNRADSDELTRLVLSKLDSSQTQQANKSPTTRSSSKYADDLPF
jgi:DNA-binding cell septation regulator SpoVG